MSNTKEMEATEMATETKELRLKSELLAEKKELFEVNEQLLKEMQ